MTKVLLYSLLLVSGLVASQFLDPNLWIMKHGVAWATMIGLSFIMIHVGYEFEIDKTQPKKYLWDYIVAGTAAAFPWVFCAMYFVYVMAPPELWSHGDLWKESLLEARFSSPTSAGVLFSMLAAAGLAATWVFRKARILAIFDDLDTILLMIPLKIMMVGFKWQLSIIIVFILLLLWAAWRYLHAIRLPVTWPWVLSYAVVITVFSNIIYYSSKMIDSDVPIHLEVLLPAFVLGCVLAHRKGENVHADDAIEGTEVGLASPVEQRVSMIVSAAFMVLVGLSMPPINADAAQSAVKVLTYEGVPEAVMARKSQFPGWGMIVFHVVMITLLSNVGKMFPAFCYRKEATLRERLALSIGMFPRGEVGAGVLVVSLGYGLGGPALTVAVLSLALNLLCTGLFIVAVKKLIAGVERPETAAAMP